MSFIENLIYNNLLTNNHYEKNIKPKQSNSMFLNVDMSYLSLQNYLNHLLEDELFTDFRNVKVEQNIQMFVQHSGFLMYYILLFLTRPFYYKKKYYCEEFYPNDKLFKKIVDLLLNCLSNSEFLSHRIIQFLKDDLTYEQNIIIKELFLEIDFRYENSKIKNKYYKCIIDNIKATDFSHNTDTDTDTDIKYNLLWYKINKQKYNSNCPQKTKLDCLNLYIDTLLQNANSHNLILNKLYLIFEKLYSIDCHKSIRLFNFQLESFIFILSNIVIENSEKLKIMLCNLNYNQLIEIIDY